MRIGIVVTTGPENGGTYFYSISMLNALRDFGQKHDYVLFYDNSDFPQHDYMAPNWTLHHYSTGDSNFTRAARILKLYKLGIFSRWAPGRHAVLLDYRLDLILCPSTSLSAWWCELPYVVAIHDVWHRYRLPGTTFFSEPFRDLIWRRAAQSARFVLVESELGKSEVISAYGIPEWNIRILPTGPAPFIWQYDSRRDHEVRLRYSLPDYYVFYPGGFSPAKNQRRIIEALALLRKDKAVDIHAILAGPPNEYSEEMSKLSGQLGIDDLIHIVGFVPDCDMPILYTNALCLVMASYIGPTNMPIWEAFALGCPVISSNAGEMPVQVGDAGLLFDPSDARQLADEIWRMYSNSELRSILAARGRLRIAPLQPASWAKILLDVIDDAVR